MEIEQHKLGVRNVWQGEIVSIKTRGLMAQVTLKIGRGDDALYVSSDDDARFAGRVRLSGR